MVPQMESVGERRLLYVTLQPGPTRKAALSSNRELRIAEAQAAAENLLVCGTGVAGMKLAELLRRLGQACRVLTEQVFWPDV